MMYEQDFIMRQIKKLTELLIQVIAKKKEDNQEQAKKMIDQALKKLSEDKSEKFHELSLEETLDILKNEGEFNAELAIAVADILFERVELSGQEDAKHSAFQALLLYKAATRNSDIAFPFQSIQKMNHLDEELSDSRRLSELKALL